jgi:hypothetical protein
METLSRNSAPSPAPACWRVEYPATATLAGPVEVQKATASPESASVHISVGDVEASLTSCGLHPDRMCWLAARRAPTNQTYTTVAQHFDEQTIMLRQTLVRRGGHEDRRERLERLLREDSEDREESEER